MKRTYNVTGTARKELVKAISSALGIKAKYLGMPSTAYQIGSITIDRNGNLTTDSDDEGRRAMEAARENGFTAEEDTKEIATQQETTPELPPIDSLEVSIPRTTLTDEQLENLKKLIASKASLIRDAFHTETTEIQVAEDKITFPWFTTPCSADEAFAYTTFVGKLCGMVRKQKRITATEKEVDNEKYAFRCFLLRLGLIGKEYKTVRKILLQNLTGSSAFKSGKKPEAQAETAPADVPENV